MYKKIIWLGIMFLFLLFATACSGTVDLGIIGGADGPTAILVSDNISLFGSFDTLIKEVPEAYEDWFFVDGIIYLNIVNKDGWEDLEISKGAFCCEIKTNTKERLIENIPDCAASRLPVGTKVFYHEERNDILVADLDGKLIPYLLIAEG